MLDLSAPENLVTYPITMPNGEVVEAKDPSADLIRRMVKLGNEIKKIKNKEQAGAKAIDEIYESMKQLGFSQNHLKNLTFQQCDTILKYVMEQAGKKENRKTSI